MQIHHSLPPVRIDVAIALLIVMAAAAVLMWRRFRRASRDRHERIDIIRPSGSAPGEP